MGKQYKSVLAIVKANSSKKFAKKFEAELKKDTVYVYVDAVSGDIWVFSELKLAKKYGEMRHEEKINWNKLSSDMWQYEFDFIKKRTIMRS